MYTIIGASGNTGSAVAEKLLAHGEKVRVVGRDAGRLQGLVKKGAEAVVANVTDRPAITEAFGGAKAVYLMIPPNPSHPNVRDEQDRVSDALATAVEKSGVERAVLLSSVGADKTDKTGPVVGLHNFENKLNGIPRLKAVYLRAGYFMENLLPQVAVIRNFGMVGGPLRGDLKLPMIATRDIGAAAADTLLKLDFKGKEPRELLGQRDLTYTEVTSAIGEAIGKPGLNYAQLPPAQLKPALMQMGMSESMANLLLEMAEALNSGYMKPLEARSSRNTTPTTIESFIAERFVPLYSGKAARA